MNWKGAPYAFVVPAAQRDPLADLRAARHPADGRGRDRPGEGGVHGRRQGSTRPDRRSSSSRSRTARSRRRCSRGRSIRTCGCSPAVRRSRRTTSPATRSATARRRRATRSSSRSRRRSTRVTDAEARADAASRARRSGRTSFGPESNAGFIAAARLQTAGVPVFRAAGGVRARRAERCAPGTWIVPRVARRRAACWRGVARETGLEVLGADEPLAVDAFRLKPGDAHRPVARRQQHAGRLAEVDCSSSTASTTGRSSSTDFKGDLVGAVRRDRAARRHQPRHDRHRPRSRRGTTRSWTGPTASATPAGRSSAQWVRDGGTLVAIGRLGRDRARAARSADREGRCRKRGPRGDVGRRPGAGGAAGGAGRRDARAARDVLEPGALAATLRERVIEPEVAVLLPGLAAAERLQHRASGRLRHAGVVAGVLRIRSGVSPDAVVRRSSRKSSRAIRRRARSSRAAGCSARICSAIRPTSSPSASAAATS